MWKQDSCFLIREESLNKLFCLIGYLARTVNIHIRCFGLQVLFFAYGSETFGALCDLARPEYILCIYCAGFDNEQER